MHEFRLGDEIDDFCIKCKRLTNHAIVSLLLDKAAKVRCRTCYHDHDFRNGVPMPSKKDLLKIKQNEEAEAAGLPLPHPPVDPAEAAAAPAKKAAAKKGKKATT
jgi:hypothetical protein